MFYALQAERTQPLAAPTTPPLVLPFFPPSVGEDHGVLPPLEAMAWQLHCSVNEATHTVSWSALQALPQVFQSKRLVSSHGWAYRGEWHGVLLSDVLATLPAPPAKSKYVVLGNALGHQRYIPLSTLAKENPLLATHVQGQALGPLYGGPVALCCFGRTWEGGGLAQCTTLAFAEKTTKETLSAWEAAHLQANMAVYAYDLKETKRLSRNGDITEF